MCSCDSYADYDYYYHAIDKTLLYVVSAIPHLIYIFIWFYPDYYKTKLETICKSHLWSVEYLDSIYVLSRTAFALKFLQFSLILSISYLNGDFGKYIQNYDFVLNFIPLFLGQLLNLSAYYKLGVEGVYYGNKLKKRNMWIMINDFPYNVCLDPIYIGACMSYYAFYGMITRQFLLYEWMLYLITTYIEHTY